MEDRGQEERKHTDPRMLEQAQDETARYGNHRYLVKPFSLDDILAHIREMVGKA